MLRMMCSQARLSMATTGQSCRHFMQKARRDMDRLAEGEAWPFGGG